MNSIRIALVATCLLWLPMQTARAQNYPDSVGLYGQVAIVAGWPDIDGFPGSPVAPETGTMAGLSFTAGYRIATWIGVDAEFMWIGGGDIINANFGPQFGVKVADASLMAITGNAKLYPLAFAPDVIPQWVQPYGVIGIGSGLSQARPVVALRASFGADNVNVFMGRFGAGLELLLTDHWGTYVDGSYYVGNDDVFRGAGTLRFGTEYNF
jgi:opacity protein-like surface antigen